MTGGGFAGAPESYAYDAEGNRTTSHLSASYIHDVANRLREDIDTCYDYDANGNLATRTAKVAGACTGDATAYEWDVLNRLVRIDNPDGTYSAYRYDAQGRRTEKDVNTSLTRYLYDDDAILLEYDGADTLLATYSHGEEVDQPLAMTRGAESFFYHTDHLGSVRLLTDALGNVANRYDYDAFGNLEATSLETVTNPFGFTARERDAESGLMFYRARYYDPKIGRFISEDPIGFAGNDTNVYSYVANFPLIFSDPSGMIFGSSAVANCVVGAAVGVAGFNLSQAIGVHFGKVGGALAYVVGLLTGEEEPTPEATADAVVYIGVISGGFGCAAGLGSPGSGRGAIAAGAAAFLAGFSTGWATMTSGLPQ